METTNHPLGSGKTTAILAKTGDPDQCPRCLGKVFQAEQVFSANAVYHKACFRCAEVECGKSLDSTSYCDSPQGSQYFCNVLLILSRIIQGGCSAMLAIRNYLDQEVVVLVIL